MPRTESRRRASLSARGRLAAEARWRRLWRDQSWQREKRYPKVAEKLPACVGHFSQIWPGFDQVWPGAARRRPRACPGGCLARKLTARAWLCRIGGRGRELFVWIRPTVNSCSLLVSWMRSLAGVIPGRGLAPDQSRASSLVRPASRPVFPPWPRRRDRGPLVSRLVPRRDLCCVGRCHGGVSAVCPAVAPLVVSLVSRLGPRWWCRGHCPCSCPCPCL